MNRLGWFMWLMLLANSSPAELSGQAIALNCYNCHGVVSQQLAVPSLEALNQQQILQALLAFKSQQRPSTIMSRLAKGYSDSELAAVAAWLGKQ